MLKVDLLTISWVYSVSLADWYIVIAVPAEHRCLCVNLLFSKDWNIGGFYISVHQRFCYKEQNDGSADWQETSS
jgi:hypothetical protein